MGRLKKTELFALIHDYLKIYLPDQKNSSPHTITSSRTSLEQLIDFICDKQGKQLLAVSIDDINSENVDAFLAWLENEKKCSISTRNQKLACIRSFLRYAVSRDKTFVINFQEISAIPIKKKPVMQGVKYLTEKAIEELLKQPDTSKSIGVRNQFMMILLYDTGARISELLNIRICDIKNDSTATVELFGKGSVFRTVPLMQETIRHYENYLKLFHPGEAPTSKQYLFYVKRHGAVHPMSDDNVRRFLNDYARQAHKTCLEIPERIHPHLFRHSRAMHLYQHGMDLTLVSQWLGHSSLEVTLVYAHADTEMKRKAIEAATSKRDDFINSTKYTLDDDELIKRLYGLR